MKEFITSLFLFLVSTSIAFSQSLTIKGKVISEEDDLPVIGASVLVKGTTVGTVTNSEGEFEIQNVPQSAKELVVSFVGMQSSTERIRKGFMQIILKTDSKTLDEVMVVAYGTVKRSAFTGSAAVLDQDNLKTPAASFDKSLAGQLPGVQVISSSGEPGSTTSFRIRGSGSLTGNNEPLYVIDGVATTADNYSKLATENDGSSNILASINPNDIESITVLKDAAAAALYGSRAANGVILITTKSGASGKAKVTFNAQYSWASLGKSYDMQHADEFYKQIYMGYRDTGLNTAEANKKTIGAITHNPYNVDNPLDENGNVVSGARLVVDTDWQKAVYRKALTKDYNLSVSGGNDKTSYFFSGGYNDQKGIVPNSSYKRYSGKVNLQTQVTSWLKAGVNVTFSHSIQNGTVGSSSGASPLFNSLTFSSAVPIYVVDTNGDYILDANGQPQFNFVNPVARDFNPLATPYMDKNKSKMYRMLASGFAEINFLDGFQFKTVISPDIVISDEHRYWNKLHGNGPTYNGRIDKYHISDVMYTSTNTLSYSKRFGEHNINVLAGMEYWQSQWEYLYAGGKNITGDLEELSAAAGAFPPESETTKEVLISYLSRVEYSFKDRYNLSLSLRTDGSSIFGKDTKWGTFWSAGGSWRMNQEDFLKDQTWIDNLKLRLSYGTSGNKGGLDRYASIALWKASADYLYGANGGLGLTQFANPNLAWEKQSMFNIGVDFSFWNRFYGSIDYFVKESDGLLYEMPLAGQNGIKNFMMNAAKTQNTGWEFAMGVNVLRAPLTWNINLNASLITDKIKDLHGNNNVEMTDLQKIWSIGGSQYEFYMPTWAGVNHETGDPQWYKVDDKGNRTITSNYAEATYERQGTSTPLIYGGISNVLSYKGFDLSIQMNYNIGGKFYDGLYAEMMHGGHNVPQAAHADQSMAWTPTNKNTDVPRYSINNSTSANSLSSRFLYDATYLKFKNITLSYTLPKNLGAYSKIVDHTKVWIAADNLYTWFADKDYKGFDDIDIFGVQGYKAYGYTYPASRTFSLGVTLNF